MNDGPVGCAGNVAASLRAWIGAQLVDSDFSRDRRADACAAGNVVAAKAGTYGRGTPSHSHAKRRHPAGSSEKKCVTGNLYFLHAA